VCHHEINSQVQHRQRSVPVHQQPTPVAPYRDLAEPRHRPTSQCHKQQRYGRGRHRSLQTSSSAEEEQRVTLENAPRPIRRLLWYSGRPFWVVSDPRDCRSKTELLSG
jgi:hypothetical protein